AADDGPAEASPKPAIMAQSKPRRTPRRPVALHGDDFGFRLHRGSQNRFSAPSVHIRPPVTRPRPPRNRRSWLRAITGAPRDAPSPPMATISAFDSIGGGKTGFRLPHRTLESRCSGRARP